MRLERDLEPGSFTVPLISLMGCKTIRSTWGEAFSGAVAVEHLAIPTLPLLGLSETKIPAGLLTFKPETPFGKRSMAVGLCTSLFM